jgi:hypothetical protein
MQGTELVAARHRDVQGARLRLVCGVVSLSIVLVVAVRGLWHLVDCMSSVLLMTVEILI